jgi:hypothetical protein
MKPRFGEVKSMAMQEKKTRSVDWRGYSDTGLYGRWRILARLGAITVAVLTMAAFLALLPAYVSYLYTVCAGAACPVGQLTPPAVQALQHIGLSVDAFVGYTLALTLFSLLMFWSVSAVIFWRKSDNWMALLVALMPVLMGTTYVTHLVIQRPSPWQIPAWLLSTLAFGALLLVFSLWSIRACLDRLAADQLDCLGSGEYLLARPPLVLSALSSGLAGRVDRYCRRANLPPSPCLNGHTTSTNQVGRLRHIGW